MGWQTFSVVQLFAGDTIINPTGLFVYSGTPAAGNLIFSIVNAAGTDQFGNATQAGATAYSSSTVFAQLVNGAIQVQGAAGQNSPGLFSASGVAGEVAISSGLATGLDSSANIIVDSSVASGIANTFISLQAAKVNLNTIASSTIPSTNINPGHQSAAPATYSQSYENASTNRINEIMDVLSQTGIWPF